MRRRTLGRHARNWTIAAPAMLALAAIAGGGGQDVGEAGEQERIELGRHIVHEVAMCVQCHSERDARGELIPEKLLTGGAIPVENPWPAQPWGHRAPYLRNEPGYDEESLVRLLSTGVAKRGGAPRPPMPPFRMTEDEARAVFAYLATLE